MDEKVIHRFIRIGIIELQLTWSQAFSMSSLQMSNLFNVKLQLLLFFDKILFVSLLLFIYFHYYHFIVVVVVIITY